MHIETSGLMAALKAAPEEQTSPPGDLSEYVMEHIYMPLRQGAPVAFADLDFDAFTDEDIRDLENWIEQRGHMMRRISDLSDIFCAAHPVSSQHRAFC